MEGEEVKAVRIQVSGRVQGVGFRWYVRREALGLGLAGRVRNLPDGRVETIAVGPSDLLARLRQSLRQGPPGARVTELTEEELSFVPDWDTFEIDR